MLLCGWPRCCSPMQLSDELAATMTLMTCCEKPTWVPKRDLAHASGFEYLLGECGRCGAAWMNVFCVATSITGYERVTLTDVEAIRLIEDGPGLKAFMKRWADENL
jgi:hypothetical protein